MIGTDIIEVSRIKRLIKEKGGKFLNKIYTQKEIDYCESKGPNKYLHYAGRFAAKESIYKALSSFLSDKPILAELKILKLYEILNQENGVPKVNFIDNALKTDFSKHKISIKVSISHIEKYASAVATIVIT